jgi:hypothetical protein
LIGVFAVACFVHAVALAFLNRILRQRRPHLNRLLTATKNPTRLALLLIALAAALPAAPLGPDGRLIFIRCLVLGTIFMIGWTALKVLHIGANLYLRNFHIDAPDNLLARKHVTQVRVLVRVLDTIIVLLTLGSALMLLYLDYSAPIRAHSVEGRRIRGTNKTTGRQACERAGYQYQPGRHRIAAPGNGGQRGRHLQSLCRTREKLIVFLQSECPQALPRRRHEISELPVHKSRKGPNTASGE